MKEIVNEALDQSIIKEIVMDYVPSDSRVDSRKFSRLLDEDKVVASYKMYWLLGILEEISAGNEEIEFTKLISRMIVHAWYPIIQYRLNFGIFDMLKRPVNYIAEKYKFSSNCDEREFLDFIYNSEDKEIKKMMKELTNKVPYRLLSPFFTEELRGKKDHEKDRIIIELSLNSSTCLYKIIKGEKDKIVLNEGWPHYLKDNYRIIKAWIYYKLVYFLQKRNPNVPAVAFKLEAPKSRDLSRAAKLWEKVIETKKIRDIYTGKEFIGAAYRDYGPLSIDHFIPWSFVLHDELWNLVPTFKNINSKKSDKLLSFDEYIDDFCEVQYSAFSFICEKKLKNEAEEYMQILKLSSPYEYYRNKNKADFNNRIKQSISPLYQIAVNQGFEVVGKIDL